MSEHEKNKSQTSTIQITANTRNHNNTPTTQAVQSDVDTIKEIVMPQPTAKTFLPTDIMKYPKSSSNSKNLPMASITQSQQFLQKISPQMATVMSSNSTETGKPNIRSPICSPLMSRKNRPNLPVSPKSTPPLPRKNHTSYPLAYNAMTGTISSPISIPAVPARVMAAIGSSPASSLSLSSSTSSPSSSPPPPPLPTRAPKMNSQSSLNRILNASPKESNCVKTNSLMTQSMNCASSRGNEPSALFKLQRSLTKTCTLAEKEAPEIDLDKLIAQQKELEEKTAALSRNTKLNANLYDAEIEMMNQYLKSLPDYREIDKKLHQEFKECEDLYDRLKRRHQPPLTKSNSHQSVMKTPQIHTSNTSQAMTNPVIKSSSINFGNKLNVENSQRYISNQQRKLGPGYAPISNTITSQPLNNENLQQSKLQRSMSSTNMPLNMVTVISRRENPTEIQQDSLEQRNSLLLASNISLNKQLMNDFWAENIATSQQRQTPRRSYWNYEKICAQTGMGTAGTPLKVDAQTAKKLAIFDPTVAEAAQKELQKKPNKLQKNASLSQLDMKVRQAVTREDIYKLICNESSPNLHINNNMMKSPTEFVSKVPVKICNSTLSQVPETALNKSTSLSNVPANINLIRSASKTQIPCYMRNPSALSRSISNTALLLPVNVTNYQPTFNTTNPTTLSVSKSSSSSSVFMPKYSPLPMKQQTQANLHAIMTTSLVARKEKPMSPLSDELMMQAQWKKATIDGKKMLTDCITEDCASLDRKSEKSNSTLSTNSITVTNCCTTHLPHLAKFTSSFHIPSTIASTDVKSQQQQQQQQQHQQINKTNKDVIDNNHSKNNTNKNNSSNGSCVGSYKIAKTQSLANMGVSKRQKDVESKIEKYLNENSKISNDITQQQSKTTIVADIPNTIARTSTHTTATVANASISLGRLQQEPSNPTSSDQVLTSNIPIYKQTQNNFPINKSNSTSQIQQRYLRKNMFQLQQQQPQPQQTNYQQKRTFLNWNSFACAQQQQQSHQEHPQSQPNSLVSNMHKRLHQQQQSQQQQKYAQFQPISQHFQSTTLSTGLASFLQKQQPNTNKENKYNNNNNINNTPQQYVAATQQHHYLPLQKKQQTYAFQQQQRNVPLTHSASFTTTPKLPTAQHLQYNNSNHSKQYFNQLLHMNAMQQQQAPAQYLYAKPQNMSVGANLQQTLSNQQQQQEHNCVGGVFHAGSGAGGGVYAHQLTQSASTSAVNVAARQMLQQQKQHQHQQFIYNTQQQQQQPSYQSNTTNLVNFTCQTQNQMSKSALALHFSEVDFISLFFNCFCCNFILLIVYRCPINHSFKIQIMQYNFALNI